MARRRDGLNGKKEARQLAHLHQELADTGHVICQPAAEVDQEDEGLIETRSLLEEETGKLYDWWKCPFRINPGGVGPVDNRPSNSKL